MAGRNIRERSVKRKAVNIGMVIFAFLFLYILISFFISLRKPQPSIYEVQKITLATNNLARAVVVREEQNVLTDYSGYVLSMKPYFPSMTAEPSTMRRVTSWTIRSRWMTYTKSRRASPPMTGIMFPGISRAFMT